MMNERYYALFEEQQQARGIDLDRVKKALMALKIETPSWGFGDSGTRFKVFRQEGVPRNIYEKLEDAAQVHKLTGMCPRTAIHIPWDKVDDYKHLKQYAKDLSISIGAVNPNFFQDDAYKLSSVCNSDAGVRRMAIDHMLECVEIMKTVGSKDLSLWFADGTNYPGQANIRKRVEWMREALQETIAGLDPDMRMLIEYKFFEPAFYHTDLADWGMAFNMANKLGDQAYVLVDTGHHPLGTNIEHIVAYLIGEHRLGGFHFNARKYADDDLIVGTTNPYELFLIFQQIWEAMNDENDDVRQMACGIAYMLDQCHNIEPKIPATLRSVINVQTQFAKALLVNLDELAEAQEKQDVLAAEYAIRRAFEIDVTPLLAAVREDMGVPVDPMEAYFQSGYAERIRSRGTGGAGW